MNHISLLCEDVSASPPWSEVKFDFFLFCLLS